MRLGTTYICCGDIQKSVDFYKALLQEEPEKSNGRWVQFSVEIALYNRLYDAEIINDEKDSQFNQAYVDNYSKYIDKFQNNLVVFNFVCDDLKSEYERLKHVNIGNVSELMYVNVDYPYWYFNITDPDGNTIEITGPYECWRTGNRI